MCNDSCEQDRVTKERQKKKKKKYNRINMLRLFVSTFIFIQLVWELSCTALDVGIITLLI